MVGEPVTLTEEDIRAISARQKIRAADAQSLGYDERRVEQERRALDVASELAGANPPRGLVRALLALVEADEKPDPPQPKSSGPAPGARRVLKRKKPALTAQDSLW